jgi:hypothetical protein
LYWLLMVRLVVSSVGVEGRILQKCAWFGFGFFDGQDAAKFVIRFVSSCSCGKSVCQPSAGEDPLTILSGYVDYLG